MSTLDIGGEIADKEKNYPQTTSVGRRIEARDLRKQAFHTEATKETYEIMTGLADLKGSIRWKCTGSAGQVRGRGTALGSWQK